MSDSVAPQIRREHMARGSCILFFFFLPEEKETAMFALWLPV
jgi:hypothetical protein